MNEFRGTVVENAKESLIEYGKEVLADTVIEEAYDYTILLVAAVIPIPGATAVAATCLTIYKFKKYCTKAKNLVDKIKANQKTIKGKYFDHFIDVINKNMNSNIPKNMEIYG